MGVGSSHIDVRVTDRKSLIRDQCLKRKEYLSLQHKYKAGSKSPADIVGGENSVVFLEAALLRRVLIFLFGSSLIKCFEVCPLWFIACSDALDGIFAKIDKGFQQFHSGMLQLEYARTDWSPVHVSEAGIRIDRVLVARVSPRIAQSCATLSYAFAYQESPSQDGLKDAKRQDRAYYECSFRFDALSRGESRTVWIHKDICRFHGDETRVAASQNITPVCANDLVEIAINVFNPVGLIDVDEVCWNSPDFRYLQRRECPIEQELFDWYDIDSFQTQSVERLQIPDFFAPQLTHCLTEYAGIDVAVSRTRLRASQPGVVPQADRILGSRFEVLPRGSPVILPLKRVGLQHDRFTKVQLRQGDLIDLYISQGGKMT